MKKIGPNFTVTKTTEQIKLEAQRAATNDLRIIIDIARSAGPEPSDGLLGVAYALFVERYRKIESEATEYHDDTTTYEP